MKSLRTPARGQAVPSQPEVRLVALTQILGGSGTRAIRKLTVCGIGGTMLQVMELQMLDTLVRIEVEVG